MYRVSPEYIERIKLNTIDEQIKDLLDHAEEQGCIDALEMTLENQFETNDPYILTDQEKQLLIDLYKPILILQGLKQNVG